MPRVTPGSLRLGYRRSGAIAHHQSCVQRDEDDAEHPQAAATRSACLPKSQSQTARGRPP
jgi:hypothetical protein